MKPLEDAEAVELNEENDYEDSESFLADMENKEGIEDEDNNSEDSDPSDLSYDKDTQKEILSRKRRLQENDGKAYGQKIVRRLRFNQDAWLGQGEHVTTAVAGEHISMEARVVTST